MANDEILRAVIANIFQYLKEDRKEYVMLANEVAALRNALQELSGGKFQPLLEKHRRLLEEQIEAAGLSGATDYDEIIRRVRAGELF